MKSWRSLPNRRRSAGVVSQNNGIGAVVDRRTICGVLDCISGDDDRVVRLGVTSVNAPLKQRTDVVLRYIVHGTFCRGVHIIRTKNRMIRGSR